jgi:DNA-directed RNA polymerase subunit RPC12/RpoP
LCPLPVHYRLTCAACAHDWEEPPLPGEVMCPRCGGSLVITQEEHAAFAKVALAGRAHAAQLARCLADRLEPGQRDRA